jgi:hypothetical protein
MKWINLFANCLFLTYSLFETFALLLSWTVKFLKPVLEPQSSGITKLDPYLKESIQLYCLFETLRSVRDKRGMVAAVVQYLQGHTNNSLFMQSYNFVTRNKSVTDWSSDEGFDLISDMIDTAFSDALREEVEGIEVVLTPHSGQIPAVEILDCAFTNWKAFRNSAVAGKFVKFINTIVACGMCSAHSLSFSLGGVELFSPVVSSKQLNAADIIEVFYEALVGFVKGGHRVFKTGEVSSFYTENSDIEDFSSRYDVLRALRGYAISGNLLEYSKSIGGYVWDDNEFDLKCQEAIDIGQSILKIIGAKPTFERKFISDRVEKLQEIHVEFTQLRTRGGLRIAPFAIKLFGKSGCGKSSLTNLTVNAGLIYNGFSAAKDRIATWADNDKFASSIRSHINAIIFDDFANTSAAFMDFSPAYRLIQVVNNIRYLAPMADVFLKGKVALNPYFCVVSTNVWDLNAGIYSNEPESVLRRFYHVHVTPRVEYCKDGTLNRELIVETFGKTSTPDVWLLDVFTYEVRDSRGVDAACLKPVVFEGKRMINTNVHEYLKWLQITSKKHFEEEIEVIQNQEEIPQVCECHKMCYCLECQSGDFEPSEHRPDLPKSTGLFLYLIYLAIFQCYCIRKAIAIKNNYNSLSTAITIRQMQLCDAWRQFDFIPESLICHPRVLNFCLIFWRRDLYHSLLTGCILLTFLLLSCLFYVPHLALVWVLCYLCFTYLYVSTTFQVFHRLIRERILSCKDVVKTYIQSWEVRYSLLAVGLLAVLISYLRHRHRLNAHAGLDPDSAAEVQVRDDKVNPWLKVESTELPMSLTSKSSTVDDLTKAFRTNIVGVVSQSTKKTSLGFYVAWNFMLLPTHFLKHHPDDEDFLIKCYKTTDKVVGGQFSDRVVRSMTVAIPNTDFTLCYVTSGGSFKDLRNFFVIDSKIPVTPSVLLTREVISDTLTPLKCVFRGTTMVRHTLASFCGGYYTLPVETKGGMCMSPLLSSGRGSAILGFHLGGSGHLGGCGIVTRTQIDQAILSLAGVDGVVLSASCGDIQMQMGTMPQSTFGKNILESAQIHIKSATRYLLPGSSCEVYGSVAGKSTAHSNVVPTIISPQVEKVFGVPQKWGPPKFKGKGVFPYQATLVHAALPSRPLGSVIVRSVSCIKSIARGIKSKIPELFETGPLTRVQTVSGIMGKKFIDPMNFNTSPGFPLTGPKKNLVVELDPLEYPECGRPRTFIPEVWEEFESAVDILRSGERCYFIWKACLKDEATKLSKDKVRVFQSAPIVLQLIVRMYFLPIVRIIQMNPGMYECAVGVNAEGLDWEYLWELSMSKGKDRVLAGDYSKYDVRMPAQVTLAAFDILLDIARQCDGYTSEDIALMEAVVSEMVYPFIAYNGDLLQLFGTNPSGQNLTVIVNSLVNVLLLRCAFYTIYPDKDFKESCSFMTYGDDVIGTVAQDCPLFNHLSYASFLGEHDMVFTMPDKESTPTEYMQEKDVDFLKRKCVMNDDLGCKVGLLSEESIFKRLHSHLVSKELSLEMHSATNIDSCLHDWFYYGREVFEDRRSKLLQVAKACDIENYCQGFEVSYEQRVLNWRHKYLGEDLEEVSEILLDAHCDINPSR